MNPLARVCELGGSVPAPQEPLEQTVLLGEVLGPRYSHRAKGDAPSLIQSVGTPFSKVSENTGEPNTWAIEVFVLNKNTNSSIVMMMRGILSIRSIKYKACIRIQRFQDD